MAPTIHTALRPKAKASPAEETVSSQESKQGLEVRDYTGHEKDTEDTRKQVQTCQQSQRLLELTSPSRQVCPAKAAVSVLRRQWGSSPGKEVATKRESAHRGRAHQREGTTSHRWSERSSSPPPMTWSWSESCLTPVGKRLSHHQRRPDQMHQGERGGLCPSGNCSHTLPSAQRGLLSPQRPRTFYSSLTPALRTHQNSEETMPTKGGTASRAQSRGNLSLQTPGTNPARTGRWQGPGLLHQWGRSAPKAPEGLGKPGLRPPGLSPTSTAAGRKTLDVHHEMRDVGSFSETGFLEQN